MVGLANSDGCRPPQPKKSLLSAASANPATIRIDNPPNRNFLRVPTVGYRRKQSMTSNRPTCTSHTRAFSLPLRACDSTPSLIRSYQLDERRLLAEVTM